jgi:glycosyltransferase involved in cell wall biosynthesis
MPNPRISVLLPVRNAVATVGKALATVFDQTLPPDEVVVVDDGSTDGTSEVLAAWIQRERRLRVVAGEGKGISRALNRGLAQCQGDWVARMDADDECLASRFEEQWAHLRNDPSLSAVGTQVEIFRDDRPVSPNMQSYGRWMGSLTTPEGLARECFIESPVCHPSVMVRRSVLQALEGYREEDAPEDYELWLRMLDSGHRISNVPRVLLRWRDQDSRLTRTDPRYRQDAHIALKARYLAKRMGSTPVVIWGAGPIGLKLFRRLKALGTRVDKLVDIDPRKIGQRIEGVPVVDPTALPSPESCHLLAAVGAHGGREDIRKYAVQAGFIEGERFTCCA